jgi:hypothetical protein
MPRIVQENPETSGIVSVVRLVFLFLKMEFHEKVSHRRHRRGGIRQRGIGTRLPEWSLSGNPSPNRRPLHVAAAIVSAGDSMPGQRDAAGRHRPKVHGDDFDGDRAAELRYRVPARRAGRAVRQAAIQNVVEESAAPARRRLRDVVRIRPVLPAFFTPCLSGAWLQNGCCGVTYFNAGVPGDDDNRGIVMDTLERIAAIPFIIMMGFGIIGTIRCLARLPQ